jgi:hypothetical protein
MLSKSKLQRRIEQKRNKRIKNNSKLNNEEKVKRIKRHNKCVVEIDSTTKTTEHRARSARSVSNIRTETYQAKKPDQKITIDKAIQIDNQINDISEEKEKREQRKNKQKEENKNNKKGKIKTEDNILKNNLKTHTRKHKRKQHIPLDKKFEGEKRYKYKEKQNDKTTHGFFALAQPRCGSNFTRIYCGDY